MRLGGSLALPISAGFEFFDSFRGQGVRGPSGPALQRIFSLADNLQPEKNNQEIESLDDRNLQQY